ncbi:MAG: hypothetical protein LBB58_00310 [Cellulomonadaceae bacterium]|jgi:hypothetical protein|nr:hypothetical protein [Cellulomonadaceae bacterium]
MEKVVSTIAEFMDDRVPEMIPIVERLLTIPELTNEYAHDSVGVGEWQEALEVFLMEADRKSIPLPEDLLADVRRISEELMPYSMRTPAEQLVAA